MDGVQPGFGESAPVGDGEIRGSHAKAVTSLGEEMELGGDFGVFERLEVDEGVFDVGGVVVFCHDEEGGWDLRGGRDGGIDFAVGAVEPAGVDHHLEVRAGVDR